MCGHLSHHVDKSSQHEPGDGDDGDDEPGHVGLDEVEGEADETILALTLTLLYMVCVCTDVHSCTCIYTM